MSKVKYLEVVKNASKLRKGFILLDKNLHKYTRIGVDMKNNVTLYNHWLDIEVTFTNNEYNFIEKNLQNKVGYNRFAR